MAQLQQLEHLDIPYDEEDYRFVHSFTVDQLADQETRDFLEEFGFLVVRDVLDQAQCQATIDEMLGFLEANNAGFQRDDQSTWHHWVGRSFGMPSPDPQFTPQIVANRQNRNLYRVFQTLIGSDDLRVNHDRWAIYRPTLTVGDEYRTRDNVHLDINPWRFQADDASLWRSIDDQLRYSSLHDFITENNHVTLSLRGRQFQAVLNLVDNEVDDGGFVIVPGFHRYFAHWCSQQPMTHTDCKYAFHAKDAVAKKAVRIPCRAGSLIVWDQRCAHGSRGNRSHRMRAVMFLKMFSADGMPEHRAAARKAALRKVIGTHHTISDIGKIVFGL
jgi:hypothetical protein